MAQNYRLPRQSSDPRGKAAFIRETAKKYGINPDVALKVAKSEGLAQFKSGVVRKDGTMEPSWGAFQLYTGGGLGNAFQKETGLDPSDPKNEDATIDYALRRAAKDGWGAWYGAAKVGIGKWDGIGGNATDPTPNVGSGEGDYPPDRGAIADLTARGASADVAAGAPPAEKKKDYGDIAGDAFEGLGKIFAGNAAQNAARPVASTTVPAAAAPIPAGVQPMVDPKMVEMQRQQLALAMQRLNSGKLF